MQKKKKKVREKSRDCHDHKPQPFPDTKRKRKQTKPNKRKSNKRTKSTKISKLVNITVIGMMYKYTAKVQMIFCACAGQSERILRMFEGLFRLMRPIPYSAIPCMYAANCKFSIWSNYHTYLLYVIGQRGLSKQFRPRSDAAERGVWSGVYTVCHSSFNLDS